jgi:hypothetical protein
MSKLDKRQKAVEKCNIEKKFWRNVAESYLTKKEKEIYYKLLQEKLTKDNF